MSKITLLLLPLATVLVVAFALFVVGSPKAYVGARLYGGPTEAAPVLAWRLALVERFEEIERPLTRKNVRVEAQLSDGRRATFRGTADDEGYAAVRIELERPVRGPIDVTVHDDAGELLARGRAFLSAEAWLSSARRRGGFLRAKTSGELQLRGAALRGTFAVPFFDLLLVEVSARGSPVADVDLSFEPEGLRMASANASTDSAGRASIALAPREHAVAVAITARDASGRIGKFYSMLPVAPGALHAKLEGSDLVIASPIERQRAYFSLVSPRARLVGGAVLLTPDGQGGARGVVPLSNLFDHEDLWAVVSSEPGLDTQTTVGWPLRVSGSGPHHTFDVADRLLLDGLGLGYAREQGRRRNARWLAGVFTALALGLTLLLVRGRVHASQRELELHLRRTGANENDVERMQRQPGALRWLVAGLCIALGFIVVALVVMYRIG
jgi:hypothetical protein